MSIHSYLAGDFSNAPTPRYAPKTDYKKQEEMLKNLVDHGVKRYVQVQVGESLLDKLFGESKKQTDIVSTLTTGILTGLPKTGIVKKMLGILR